MKLPPFNEFSCSSVTKRSEFLRKKKKEEENNDSFRFVTEEQKNLLKKSSVQKRNRFKMRRKAKNKIPKEDF